MRSKLRFWNSLACAGALVAAAGGLSGCGGGGSDNPHVERPVVREFSPYVSKINFGSTSLTQNPTFTTGRLDSANDDSAYWENEWRNNASGARVPQNLANPGTDTNYGRFGRLVVYFNDDTRLDPDSIKSSDPADPLDHNALLITKYTPGVGNEILSISEIIVETNRIILKPANFARVGVGNPPIPLADGQYTIRVGTTVLSKPYDSNKPGKPLSPGPVFMTFTVGLTDAVPPFVVNTSPGDQQTGVGAGVPPPAPPTGVGASQIADVRTSIFGPTSPDIRIEFNEPIRRTSVTLNNFQLLKAGQGGGNWPIAPGFPKLKSEIDGETLPSNGHEVIVRADPLVGGLPFQSAMQVTVVGKWNSEASQLANPGTPDNGSPVTDLSNNGMDVSKVFTFFTIAPPDVPQNPFPEYSIWWAASDRVGVIDTINMQGLADQFNGTAFPLGVPRNVIPQFTDTVTSAQHIPGFSPTEMLLDQRTSAGLCHSYVYVMSPSSGQIAIVNTRTSLPVALINTPTPGGIAGQFASDGANVLLVTNSSANTITIFDFSNITPGTAFLNGPIFIQRVLPTGNTPRAITITGSSSALIIPDDWNRDGAFSGPPISLNPATPVVMWADFTDGVVNTYNLGQATKSQSFALGANAAPNDVVLTPCFGLNPIMFGAISQGGQPNQGKVAYYVAGPGCATGTATGARPDSIVGDLSGFDGPAGLDEVISPGLANVFFVVAESGTQANRVTTLGVQTGAINLPRALNSFTGVGANPTSVAHRPAWVNPCTDIANDGNPIPCLHDGNPTCHYNGVEMAATNTLFGPLIDGTEAVSQNIYICATGVSQVTVVNMNSGSFDFYSPISIPGVRRLASTCSQ